MNNVIYASDIDRTLVFSDKFLEEYPSKCKYEPVEYYKDKIISYMSTDVKSELAKVNSNKKVEFIPITSRSIDEYNRIDFGFKSEYAVVASGGVILHNGEIVEEYADYIKSHMNNFECMDLLHDVSELDSVIGDARIVDNCYIFCKTNNPAVLDMEIQPIIDKYSNWEFTRQNRKIYILPYHFSKQIALRWLWNKLGKPYIVASGDGILDIPMLTLADRAIIPEHAEIIKSGYIESCEKASGGIESPLYTIKAVLDKLGDDTCE